MTGDKLVKLIQNEITARNLSIRDFARLVGVSHPTILEMVRRYLRILKTDVETAHRRASPVDHWRL